MKRKPAIPTILLATAGAFIACTAARTQVVPSATGASAKLDYDLSYSQTAEFYAGDSETVQMGTVSGEVEYLNGYQRAPFSLTYSGGYISGISGPDTGTGVFQHILLSQGYFTRRGSVSLRDDLGFYPQTPTTGFSGIPGVGDLPGEPGLPSEPILTLNTRSLNNTATATFTHTLNYDTTFSIDGNFDSIRFPDGGGLDINQVGMRPEVSWRLNALNYASVEYSFSRFNYLGSPFTMETQSVQPGFYRVWNRRLTTSVSAGPEWIQSDNDLIVPPTVGASANVGVIYTAKSTSATFNYYRSVSAGAGFATQIGIRNNYANASISRTYGRDLTIIATGSYMDSQGLVQPGVTNAEYGGVIATRRMGEYITISANYTALHQTSSLPLETNALKGISQVIGFSIAYHPRETHFVRK
jgi:hypothetical protein